MVKKGTPASPATALANRVFPVPGGANQEDTLGDPGPKLDEFLWFFQKFDYLCQLFLGFFRPGNIGKGYLRLILGGIEACPALAKGHDPVPPTLGLLHDEDPDPDQENNGEEGRKEGGPPGRRRWRFPGVGHPGLFQPFYQFSIIGVIGGEFFPVFEFAFDGTIYNDYPIYLSCLKMCQKGRIGNLLHLGRLVGIVVYYRESYDYEQ